MSKSCFFFQAEDGIRDDLVTGVQTCALPISEGSESENGSASVTRRTTWPSKYARACPSLGLPTCPAFPGWTIVKSDTAKRTTTGSPPGTRAPSLGDRIVRVGAAAFAVEAENDVASTPIRLKARTQKGPRESEPRPDERCRVLMRSSRGFGRRGGRGSSAPNPDRTARPRSPRPG